MSATLVMKKIRAYIKRMCSWKICSCCRSEKYLEDFYQNRHTTDGRYSQCKSCHRHVMQNQRAKRGKPSRDRSMYIFSNPMCPGVLKIGQSMNPSQRVKLMASSLKCKLEIVATFAHWGDIESDTHDILRTRRVPSDFGNCSLAFCKGREWFICSIPDAIEAVVQARRARDARISGVV